MVNEANRQEVERLNEQFMQANCALMADFQGVTASEMTVLRKQLRESNAKLKIVKNTLARLAVKGTDFEKAAELFEGPVSVAFGLGEDIGAPAKALREFSKKHKNLKILGGIVEGSLLDEKGVRKLADMPPKPVVQAMLLGLMQAPARNFMGVLQGVSRKFLYLLNAQAENLGKD